MRKGFKWSVYRVLCAILALSLIIASESTMALAAGLVKPVTDIETCDTSVIGSDLGNLLAPGISKASATADSSSQKDFISDVEVNNGIAKVTYETSKDATIVVAIYEESTGKMVSSGSIEVAAQTQKADVQMQGENPEFYIIKAFLLESETNRPLCDSYESKLHTQELQKLIRSKVSDYDSEKVVNFDNSDSTNFAVVEQGVVNLKAAGDTAVSFAQNADGTYTVINPDEYLASLKEGDKVVYAANSSTYIFKVKTIVNSGSVLTIIPDTDLELADIFSDLKIETTGGSEGFSITEGSLPEGVTVYDNNSVSNSSSAAKLAASEDFTLSKGKTYKISKEGDKALKGKVSGSIGSDYSLNIKYYFSRKYADVSIKLSYTYSFNITVGGAIEGELPLGEIKIPTEVPGVFVVFTPKFKCSFEAAITWTLSFGGAFGGGYSTDTGFKNLSEFPKPSSELELEGKFSIGFEGELAIAIIDEKIADLALATSLMLEFSTKPGLGGEDGDTSHSCSLCTDGDVNLVLECVFKCKVWGLVDKEEKLWGINEKLGDFYHSWTYNEFAWTSCPHISYKVTVKAIDANKKPVAGAVVTGSGIDKNASIVTDANGEASFYVPTGSHFITVATGDLRGTKRFRMLEEPKTFKIILGNFTDLTAELDLYGEATVLDDGSVRLTENATWRSGSVWYAEPVSTKNGFSVSVNFFAGGGRDDSYGGADGIVLNFASKTGLGAYGGDIGFCNEVGVELDSYPHNSGDPAKKHVAVIQGNVSNHLVSTYDDRVDDSEWHTLEVVYDGAKLKAYIDNRSVLECRNLTLNDEIYIGFTAATGAGRNLHMISDFTVIGDQALVILGANDYGTAADSKTVEAMTSFPATASRLSAFEGNDTTAGGYSVSSFSGLVPGQRYALVVANNIGASDLFSGGNLFYIDQGVADASGKLSFSYIPMQEGGAAKAFGYSTAEMNGEDPEDTPVLPAAPLVHNTINAKNITKTANGKKLTFKLGASNIGKTAMTYTSNNKKVKVSKDGKVTVAKNFVGKAKITVKALATDKFYSAAKDVTITVKPAKVAISSVKKDGKKLTASWKRNATATGYEVQYSSTKNFKKGTTTKLVKKNKTTKLTVTVSNPQSTSYVRVRAYKLVGGKKIYSAWSKVLNK